MSKIAIISQPDQGVLIDVSGCTSLKEALEHLSSTLQVSSQFWKGMNVSLNLGKLELAAGEISQILALAKGVGIQPSGVYTSSETTKESLQKSGVPLETGKPMTLPTVPLDAYNHYSSELEEADKKRATSPIATIKMRVADAMSNRKSPKPDVEVGSVLEDMAPIKEETMEDTVPPKPEVKPTHLKAKRKVFLDGRQITVEEEKQAENARAEKARAESPMQNSDAASQTVRTPDSSGDTPKGGSQIDAATHGTTTAHSTGSAAECATTGGSAANQSAGAPVECSSVVAKDLSEASAEISKSSTAPESAQVAVAVADINVQNATATDEEPAENARADDVEDDLIANAEEYNPEEEVEADSLETEDGQMSGPNTLYLRQNLRSGQTVSHKGHLVIIGDINPGAEVMAEGDITVWGSLRGVAHAGIGGNTNAEIRALKLQPIQIRIAQAIARAPDRPRLSYAHDNGPETARIVGGKIKVFRSRLD